MCPCNQHMIWVHMLIPMASHVVMQPTHITRVPVQTPVLRLKNIDLKFSLRPR